MKISGFAREKLKFGKQKAEMGKVENSGWTRSARCNRSVEPDALPVAWMRFSLAATSDIKAWAAFTAWAAA
jgi:hypothetical protein